MLTWEVLVSHNTSQKPHQIIITRKCLQKLLHHFWVIERWRNRRQILLDPLSGEEHVVSFEGTKDLPGSDACRAETHTHTHTRENHVQKLVNYARTYIQICAYTFIVLLCYHWYETCIDVYTHKSITSHDPKPMTCCRWF